MVKVVKRARRGRPGPWEIPLRTRRSGSPRCFEDKSKLAEYVLYLYRKGQSPKLPSREVVLLKRLHTDALDYAQIRPRDRRIVNHILRESELLSEPRGIVLNRLDVPKKRLEEIQGNKKTPAKVRKFLGNLLGWEGDLRQRNVRTITHRSHDVVPVEDIMGGAMGARYELYRKRLEATSAHAKRIIVWGHETDRRKV